MSATKVLMTQMCVTFAETMTTIFVQAMCRHWPFSKSVEFNLQKSESFLFPGVSRNVGYKMFLYTLAGCQQTLHTHKVNAGLL